MSSISPQAQEELLAQLDPWLALLSAQAPEFDEIGLELSQELVACTRQYAQECQSLNLRGLSNCFMLLVRGLEQSQKARVPVSEDDSAQLILWLSGVQSYLRSELVDPGCLVSDLAEIKWVPKLAPALVDALGLRLQEGLTLLPPMQLAPDLVDALFPPDLADASAAPALAKAESFSIADLPDFSLAEHDSIGIAPEMSLADNSELFGFANLGELGDDAAESQSSDAFAFEPQAAGEFAEGIEIAALSLPADTSSELEDNGPVWIATEEFQLVTETVQARLLPTLTMLATDLDAIAENYTETCYQIELLGNAFEVLSLPNASQMTQRLLSVLHAPGADMPPLILARAPALMTWVVALVDFCDNPDSAESRSNIVDTISHSDWIAPQAPAEVQALAVELVRIHVGLDPKLKQARKIEVTEADMLLTPAADVMHNVLQGMLMELPGNAQSLSESIAEFILSGDVDAIDQARRVAHTLKGDANTVGIRGIATLTHALEDIFIEVSKNPGVPAKNFAELMTQAADCVSEMADHVLGRGDPPDDGQEIAQRVLVVANQLMDGDSIADLAMAGVQPAVDLSAHEKSEASLTGDLHVPQLVKFTPPPKVLDMAGVVDVPMLQIPADVLDRLLDFSSEALVLLRQIDTQIKTVDESQFEMGRQRQQSEVYLSDLDKLILIRGAALQSARSKGDVDPLELDQYNELYMVSRRLVEANSDEQTAKQAIEMASRKLAALVNDQEKVQLELQDQLMRTRRVPVRDFVGRFQRAVRQTAKMLDKEVELTINGQDTLVDRLQMENLIDPLMHALRNAVDHGIEQQNMRMTRNKPIVGKVTLSFNRDNQFVTVKLVDDGAGLNYDRIRAKAISKGLIGAGDGITEDDLAQVILLPGFSTKEEVTQVSGRGIGLDVVYQRIQDLRGSLQIRSKQGAGTTMDIYLPTSTNSQYVALAKISSTNWVAVATDTVESFQLIEPAHCSLVGDQLKWLYEGNQLTVSDLAALTLGQRTQATIPSKAMTGALIRAPSGELMVGMLPEVSEMRTVITKDFGPYMRVFPGVRGGTILGSGEVAPVIDARELIRSVTSYQPWSMRDEQYRQELAKLVRRRIIVADDSLSVRRSLNQLLSDAGYEVTLARDGLEALTLAKISYPDILLVDLEMPRMNGLELASHLRFQEGVRDMPIIMITSRAGEKHQQMASEAGINEVVAKPYQDDALLSLIAGYLARAEVKEAA